MGFGFYKEAAPALPHPPIPLAVFLVVEEAIRVAWRRLPARKRPGFDLATADEDVVTHELYEVLFDDVFGKGIVAGFDRELLTCVTREPKLRNFNGRTLDKMPDLLVGMVDRPGVFKPTQDWLFIECKPVDPTHSAGVHYCGKGIVRFIEGDYAWTMTSAMMVGYARTGYTISSKLSVALKDRASSMLAVRFPTRCQHSTATEISEATHISEHKRCFTYIENGTPAPPITIRHLWLARK